MAKYVEPVHLQEHFLEETRTAIAHGETESGRVLSTTTAFSAYPCTSISSYLIDQVVENEVNMLNEYLAANTSHIPSAQSSVLPLPTYPTFPNPFGSLQDTMYSFRTNRFLLDGSDIVALLPEFRGYLMSQHLSPQQAFNVTAADDVTQCVSSQTPPNPLNLASSAISLGNPQERKIPCQTSRQPRNVEFLLNVIAFAEKYGTNPTAKFFNIEPSLIHSYRGLKDALVHSSLSDRPVGAGRKPFFPTIEREVFEWVMREGREGRRVSISQIKLKADELAKIHGEASFKGSASWVRNFLRRNKLDDM